MADAKRCDICENYYMPPRLLSVATGYSLLNLGFSLGPATLDLCPHCGEKLNEFVDSMKREYKEEEQEK